VVFNAADTTAAITYANNTIRTGSNNTLYDSAIIFNTTAAQDAAAITSAQSWANTPYNACTHNCVDMVNTAVNAAGQNTVDTVRPNSWAMINSNKGKVCPIKP
jgi:hypothetical protein